jgi:hypothetical protein
MGIPVSLILIAVGLVLALAINPTNSNAVDVNVVGWIVFGVGAFGLLLTLLLWDSWFGRGFWARRTYVADAPGYGPPTGRRRTVVEEDDAPPPGPPP